MKSQERKQETHFAKYTFSLFFENYPHTVIELNPDGLILNANPASAHIFQKESVDLRNHSLFDYFVPEEKERIINNIQKDSGDIKANVQLQNRAIVPVEMTFNRINNPELKTLLIHLKIPDQKKITTTENIVKPSLKGENISQGAKSQIIELKTLNRNLQDELNCLREELVQTKKIEKKFRNLTEMLPEIVFEADKNGKITFMNQKGIQVLGYDQQELFHRMTIWQIISHPGSPITSFKLEDFFQKKANYPQECYLIKKDKTNIPVEIHGSPIKNDVEKTIGFRGIILDISKRKEYEDRIKYLSFHDKLTGLYNRAYFEEELKRLNHKRNLPISIIIGDVNNLKMINDTFGHQHGDHLLQKIANVLKSCFRKSDVISRWGGDEFSVILPNTPREKGIDIIYRIGQECKKKSTLTLPLSISMGIATKSNMSENIYAVVREAESKMYRYKLIDKQATDSSIISSLEKALQQRKYETKEYRQNFIDCAIQFGKILKLEKQRMKDLRLLAMICDMGKIAISEEIILKKGWLSENEWEEIKRHPEIGFRIAKSSPELAHIADAILYHHEFWNGLGYPQGIKEKNIPILSRVIHIVNAYQAMIHERPYRQALSKEDAIAELKKGKGSQFDPELTDKFIAMVE
jgi:diguanylate cyclase (GGDEF)-like protein/PAS domain S-box-containing protein